MSEFEKIKRYIFSYARRNYPKIKKGKWSLYILQWADGDFQMSYFNTRGDNRISLDTHKLNGKRAIIKYLKKYVGSDWMIYESKIIKEFKNVR